MIGRGVVDATPRSIPTPTSSAPLAVWVLPPLQRTAQAVPGSPARRPAADDVTDGPASSGCIPPPPRPASSRSAQPRSSRPPASALSATRPQARSPAGPCTTTARRGAETVRLGTRRSQRPKGVGSGTRTQPKIRRPAGQAAAGHPSLRRRRAGAPPLLYHQRRPEEVPSPSPSRCRSSRPVPTGRTACGPVPALVPIIAHGVAPRTSHFAPSGVPSGSGRVVQKSPRHPRPQVVQTCPRNAGSGFTPGSGALQTTC